MKTVARTLTALLIGVTAIACGDDDVGGEIEEPCDFSDGNICTIAGSGENGYDGDEGPAVEAKLSLPQDTLTDDDGDTYILDWNNHRIRKLQAADGLLVHVAGRGELGGTLDDPENEDFNHPTNIIWDCDSGNDILIAAWHNSKVRRLDVSSGDIVDEAGDGRRAYFGDDTAAMLASLDLPAALACNPDDNLVIMDQANQVIRMIDEDDVIHRIAGQCIIDGAPPNGPGPCDAPTQCPGGSGKWTCGDPMTTCTRPCTPKFAGEEVDAYSIRMAQPFGQSADPAGRIMYDEDGNLLFADTSNHIIRKIDTAGIVTTIAGTPPDAGVAQKGYDGDGGPATEAKLNNPVDLALGDDGTLYFSDVYNNCIRAIDGDGEIRTVVGVCEESGYEGDGGPADAALLKLPFGIEWHDGVLYISDTGNNVIRAVRGL